MDDFSKHTDFLSVHDFLYCHPFSGPSVNSLETPSGRIVSQSPDPSFLPKPLVRVQGRRVVSESCDEGHKTNKVEVGIEFHEVCVETDGETSRILNSEVSMVHHNSDILTDYVLTSFEPSKMFLKSPT